MITAAGICNGARSELNDGLETIKGDCVNSTYYSANYSEARRRFTEAVSLAGAHLSTYDIPADSENDLAIDVASIGPDGAPTVVVSSGVHGVEGFLGSAVQLALLTQLSQLPNSLNIRYILIHSLNPFGFAQLRRFNEDNVDLNRNFHAHAKDYHGAPDGYAILNGFLNPQSPPSRFEPVKLKAAWQVASKGMQTLKRVIAGGQYEFPSGIFFGGHRPCRSTQIVFDNCDQWIGASSRIIHLDFHSGLGKFGKYKLLLTDRTKADQSPWYADTFGAHNVERLGQETTAYQVSGLFDQWTLDHFSSRDYRFGCVEFGTYGPTRVLAAIRAENRVHHYAAKNSKAYRSAKAELLECFCPHDVAWRNQIVESGLEIIGQATRALSAAPGN